MCLKKVCSRVTIKLLISLQPINGVEVVSMLILIGLKTKRPVKSQAVCSIFCGGGC